MRQINRLNAQTVKTLTEPGRYADGGNLYLSISENGGRRWTFLYRWHGKPTEIGFGSARDVTLARARELAKAARAKLAEGIPPTGPRRAAEGTTFGDMAARVMEAMRPQWRNEKHAAQWEMTLTQYAAPLYKLPVDKITTEDVLGVLKPLWATRNETASRVRSRIERVLDAAKAKGLRSGENPARWRGHLDQLLPKQPRLAKDHLAAMAYKDVPAFMARLREEDHPRARALEFAILTAARSGEVLLANRSEFDLQAKTWTVPKERMKAGREHIVPLSDRAVEIIAAMPEGELVFANRGNRMHNLTNVLAAMEVTGATAHGFRSSFRDWAGDETQFAHEIIEFALAHGITDATEAAYRRGTAIEKRRALMKAWEQFITGAPAANVVPFERTA